MNYWLNLFARRSGFGPGRELRVLGPYMSRHAAFAFAHVPLAGGWRYDHTLAHAEGAAQRVVFDLDGDPLPPAQRAGQPVPAAA